MILITGATGFLGSNLLKRLLEMGYHVCYLKRSDSDCSRIANITNACACCVINECSIESIFETYPIRIVIHCATNYGKKGEPASETYQSNLLFPLELADCAARHGCRYFINTDTFFVKRADTLWREGTMPYMAAYTRSKYLFSCVLREQAERRKMSFINLQLEHIYGPGDDKHKFVSFLLEQLLQHADVIELTEGKQVRDFIYLEDVLDAYLVVLKNLDRFREGGFYQLEVGTGKTTALRDFIMKAKEVTDSPSFLDFGKKTMQDGELMYSCADNEALLELGWVPQFDIERGLERIVMDMRGKFLSSSVRYLFDGVGGLKG